MLRDIVSQVTTARTAERLFAHLGYTPDGSRLDDGSWLVARWRTYRIVAVDAANPRDAARALAHRLAAASERALAVAIDGQDIALAAPRLRAPGSTRVLVVSRSAPTPGAIQQLERLRPDRTATALAHALRVAELLSSEAVGERFFAAFRLTLERMTAAAGTRGSPADRRLAALLTLTRVLFLYFVQTKGWLDGRPDYLRTLLDDRLARRRHFHRTALHPLFFGTLNRDPAHRSGAARLGQIPYLNGGLFQPHPVEQRLGPVVFGNGLWRDTFDGLFERFRFCAREADEVDAVAPDTLGRVFERVMDHATRHETGTYYTPESVVRQIVDATLETALASMDGIGPDAARRAVAGTLDRPAQVRAVKLALRRFRLLDPAVGSGAFLLVALESLTRIRIALDGGAGRRAGWLTRRDVLRENLFGVDLSPVAVRLAELRLWLAVVADDPTTNIAQVVPLPNLDGVIRQGDTLLDPIGAARAFGSSLPGLETEAAAAVRDARSALFQARGEMQRQTAVELRVAERRMASLLLESASTTAKRRMRDLAATATSPDLFGRRAGLSAPQRRIQQALERQLAGIATARSALSDGEVPFFAFEVHAPEILAAGGFTAVVGNPPWVRAERLSPARRRALKQRFPWWCSAAGTSGGYAHLPDLSVAFLERALELTAPNGAVGFLLPSKIVSAGYGETARRHLVAENRITYVHRVPDREAAHFRATTYPIALVVQRTSPDEGHRVRLGFGGERSLRQRSLARPGPWLLIPDRGREALDEFCAAGRPLAEIAPPGLGVKTGADDVLVGTVTGESGCSVTVRFGGQDVEIEPALLRPALRGRDVAPFLARPGVVLLWAHDLAGAPRQALPPLAAGYLDEQAGRLRARSDYRTGPPWTVFRVRRALASSRVVWSDIARRPGAVAIEASDVPDAIPLNTCYVAVPPDPELALVIAATINSTWTFALARVTADEARGGYRRINARVAGRVPVPNVGTARTRLAALSLEAHAKHGVDQADLDDAVADALGLTAVVQDRLRALATHHG